jgi:hypothetical protein
MLNRGSVTTRVLHGLLASARAFPAAALAGALPGVVLLATLTGVSPLHVAAIVIAAALVVAGAAATAVTVAAVSLVRALPGQDFGLVRGHRADSDDDEALTDWLHAYLQDLAGRPPDRPLTFGDLDGVVVDEERGTRGINLQMMTTALSMGRPFSLPLRSEQFYFRRSELELYFPAAVVAWMTAHPGPRSPRNRARDDAMATFGYLPLPTHATLPVVVAARMSLSFPLLLCGIPLYRYGWERAGIGAATDFDESAQTASSDAKAQDVEADAGSEAADARAPRYDAANVRKILFSDGGICSNFPVHLFDSVLPGWPTFGINLRDDLPATGADFERAYLPGRGRAVPPEDYFIERPGAAGVVAFASAIVRTMQNWRDNLQRAAPGFRDRVVTIRHTPREGGLNLDMAPRDLDALTASGRLGAQKLIDAFATPAEADADHFTYHRWLRIRSLLKVLQQMLAEIDEGVTGLTNHPPYPDLIRDAPAYVGGSYRLSEPARAAAAQLLDALDRLDRELKDAGVDYARTAPRPEVELRIQPVW